MLSATTRAAITVAVRRTLGERSSSFCWYTSAVMAGFEVDGFGKTTISFDLFTPVFGRVARVPVAPEDIDAGADTRPLFKFIGFCPGGSFVPQVGELIASSDYMELKSGLSSSSAQSTGGLFRVVRVEPVVNNPVAIPVTCFVVLEDSI